jgi:hypothetical protein
MTRSLARKKEIKEGVVNEAVAVDDASLFCFYLFSFPRKLPTIAFARTESVRGVAVHGRWGLGVAIATYRHRVGRMVRAMGKR